MGSLFLFLFIPACAWAANQPIIQTSTKTLHIPVVQQITFARHSFVDLTDDEVDRRLQDSNKVLQKKDSPTDIACPVKFVRKNSQVIFSDPNLAEIDSRALYDQLNALPALAGIRTKTVLDLTYCDGISTETVAGCGDLNGSNIVLTNFVDVKWEGIDFAHEFGHNQGLDDLCVPGRPCAPGDERRIMNGDPGPINSNEVTKEDCLAFQKK